MKRKSASVVIPYDKAEELLDLSDLIIEKYEGVRACKVTKNQFPITSKHNTQRS